MINIGGRIFELVHDHKGGWNPEAFRERYSEVLDRYDYVIGDWGYSQLRLKGFYRDNHPKATKDTAIGHLVDYLHEYCNFGCAYFVLKRVQTAEELNSAAGEENPSVFTSALPATGETAAGLAGKAQALPGSDRLMRWRADQSTGREGRALRIAAERAELEALILQRELREAKEREQQKQQQRRQGQPHKNPGSGQQKPQGQGGGQHGGSQHGGKRGGSSGGRHESRGGGQQQSHGAQGKGERHQGDRHSQPNGRKSEAPRGDGHRNRQPHPRSGDGPRGQRHPKGDRPNGDQQRHRRPNAPQTAPAGSGEA